MSLLACSAVPPSNPQSRTRRKRDEFLEEVTVRSQVFRELEDAALSNGWQVTPSGISLADARRRFKSQTIVGPKHRPFRDKSDFAWRLLRHCAMRYSLEDSHVDTVDEIRRVLARSEGRAPLEALRAAVETSADVGVREMCQSRSWLASVLLRASAATSPQNPGRPLWRLAESPVSAFAGIYIALLKAVGYEVRDLELVNTAWTIASISEGLALSEVSRARPPGVRPRRIPIRHARRRATDLPEPRPALAAFLILKVLEPVLAEARAPETVESGAAERFDAHLAARAAFADR